MWMQMRYAFAHNRLRMSEDAEAFRELLKLNIGNQRLAIFAGLDFYEKPDFCLLKSFLRNLG